MSNDFDGRLLEIRLIVVNAIGLIKYLLRHPADIVADENHMIISMPDVGITGGFDCQPEHVIGDTNQYHLLVKSGAGLAFARPMPMTVVLNNLIIGIMGLPRIGRLGQQNARLPLARIIKM